VSDLTRSVLHRPVEPELQAAQRCRVVFEWVEVGESHHCAERGWGRIDGPWLLFFSDENEEGYWQSWPMHTVVCVDWELPNV
jgi:hypothetical protein